MRACGFELPLELVGDVDDEGGFDRVLAVGEGEEDLVRAVRLTLDRRAAEPRNTTSGPGCHLSRRDGGSE